MSRRTLFKLLAILAIANFLILLGRGDLWTYIRSNYYWIDLLIGVIDVGILMELVDRLNIRLNEKVPWRKNFQRRLIRQLGLAVILPTGLAVLITFLQDTFIYRQESLHVSYFVNEFIVSILFIVIVNLVFLLIYYMQDPIETDNNEITIIGSRAGKKFPVISGDIAYILLKSDVTILTTFSWEDVLLPENLDFYEKKLPSSMFFRANRQSIINKKVCKSFESIENGKIQINIRKDTVPSVTVSQKKASRFRNWIKE